MAQQSAGIGVNRRFKSTADECPICHCEFDAAAEITSDLPGLIYQHQEYWCGEWADGETVEGGFERDNPING